MRKRPLLLAAAVAGLATFLVAGTADAAAPPIVYSVLEAHSGPGTQDQLIVLGAKLTKAKGALLRSAAGDVPLAQRLKSKNLLVFELPDGTAEGAYTLVIDIGKGAKIESAITLTRGNVPAASVDASRLAPDLRTDVDDAATLGGEPPSTFRDASKVSAGTLDPARYSSYDDLVAEGKIGTGAGQLLSGSHDHDDRYFTETEMQWRSQLVAVGQRQRGDRVDRARRQRDRLRAQQPRVRKRQPGEQRLQHGSRSIRRRQRSGRHRSGPVLHGERGLQHGGRREQHRERPHQHGARLLHVTPANRSSAFGSFNVTNGDFSTVVGFNNTTSVSATQAIVLGASSSATGLGSVAIGRSCTTGGSYATTTGFTNTASGDTSTAIGSTNLASGTTATATGFTTTASGNFATSMGTRTTAQAYASLVIGQFNTLSGTTTAWVATDPVLVVGNGASVAAPANALTLLKNGNMTIAGTLTQASDERLKESVEELSGVLERLKDVRGVSYRFRKDAPGPQGRQVGLVAQEVRKAFPELVHEDSDGTLSVAYGNFSAVLLEAVKEQQRQIEAQRVELQRRDAQFARLAAAVAALEKRLDASEDAKLRRGHFGISDRRRPPISFSIGEVAL